MFDCAFRPAKGKRSLPPMAHVMMGSGAAVPVRCHLQDRQHAQRRHT